MTCDSRQTKTKVIDIGYNEHRYCQITKNIAKSTKILQNQYLKATKSWLNFIQKKKLTKWLIIIAVMWVPK